VTPSLLSSSSIYENPCAFSLRQSDASHFSSHFPSHFLPPGGASDLPRCAKIIKSPIFSIVTGGSSRDVAAQVEFESKGLQPGSNLIGSRVESRAWWTFFRVPPSQPRAPAQRRALARVSCGRFQAMGQLDSTCTAPPRLRLDGDELPGEPEHRAPHARHRALPLGLHALPGGVRLVTYMDRLPSWCLDCKIT
jgi:hypothetical protein